MNTKFNVFLLFLLYWIQNSLAHSYEKCHTLIPALEVFNFFLK